MTESGLGNDVTTYGFPRVEIRRVVEIAIREDDEPTVLRSSVLPGLLLRGEGILVLGLGLKDDEGEPSIVEEQEVDEPFLRLLEVVAEGHSAR